MQDMLVEIAEALKINQLMEDSTMSNNILEPKFLITLPS